MGSPGVTPKESQSSLLSWSFYEWTRGGTKGGCEIGGVRVAGKGHSDRGRDLAGSPVAKPALFPGSGRGCWI